MAVNRANLALWMICRPSKDMFSILKRISCLYLCMPYATTQTQTTTYIFFFCLLFYCGSLDNPHSNHAFYFKIYFIFAASSLFPWLLVWICCVSSGVCSATPLHLGFIFIPRPRAEKAFMELLFSVHFTARDTCQRLSDTLHHLCSTQHHCPWHGHYGFCWACVMKARPLGSLLPWRESRMINCKGIFVYFFKLRFPVFLRFD